MPQLRLDAALRVAVALLIALAIVFLLDGDAGASGATGTAAVTAFAGWAFTSRGRPFLARGGRPVRPKTRRS